MTTFVSPFDFVSTSVVAVNLSKRVFKIQKRSAMLRMTPLIKFVFLHTAKIDHVEEYPSAKTFEIFADAYSLILKNKVAEEVPGISWVTHGQNLQQDADNAKSQMEQDAPDLHTQREASDDSCQIIRSTSKQPLHDLEDPLAGEDVQRM